jgi:hypothetical protein
VVALPDGMRQVFEAMEREGRIPQAESAGWEDALITWHIQQAHRRTEVPGMTGGTSAERHRVASLSGADHVANC